MESIWSQTCELTKRPALSKDIEVDVAVIGGGMAGILTAWQLERAGVRTVVLEADKIGGGQTKNTTAKITSQHGMFCHTFLAKNGRKRPPENMYRRTSRRWRNTKESYRKQK